MLKIPNRDLGGSVLSRRKRITLLNKGMSKKGSSWSRGWTEEDGGLNEDRGTDGDGQSSKEVWDPISTRNAQAPTERKLDHRKAGDMANESERESQTCCHRRMKILMETNKASGGTAMAMFLLKEHDGLGSHRKVDGAVVWKCVDVVSRQRYQMREHGT